MKLVKLTHCPYCSTPFKVENPDQLHQTKFGVVACECDRFPIIHSILYCKKDDVLLHRQLVQLIEHQRYNRAVWVSLAQHNKVHRGLTFLVYLLRQKQLSISEQLFLRLLLLLGPGRSWFRYLLRKDRHTLETAVAVVARPTAKDEVVIDIGCGWGDLVTKIKNTSQHRDTKVIAIDKSMFSLLAAQLFHVYPDVLYVCADVEAGLPIRSESASRVVFLDCFMWIYKKKFLIAESHRVLKSQGSIDIINVHEPRPETSPLGYGISVRQLKQYFKGLFHRSVVFANHLNQHKQILLVRKVDELGYSCQAIKLNALLFLFETEPTWLEYTNILLTSS